MSFSYANAGSGLSAGGIGWFDFGPNFVINPGQTINGLTGTLKDGSTVTFNLSSLNVSGGPNSFNSYPVPIYTNSFFGNTQYTGIVGDTALYSQNLFAANSQTLTISGITVKDSMGNPIPYTAVLADAESTNTGEIWTWGTNGGGWALFNTVGSPAPALAGLGSPTATITGNVSAGVSIAGDYLLTTTNPTQLTLNVSLANQSARQGFSLGFAITKLTVQKNVGARINSADQFVLNVTGTPSAQATTSGNAVGIQPQVATLYSTPGNIYTINEAMAPGSVSALSNYTQIVSAVNLTNTTVPPTGSLPINYTAALGDEVVYTITNAAPESFKKSVDKPFAQPGDVLTYTVTGTNPNNFPVPGVVMTDPTPAGTTYIGNLVVTGATSSSGTPPTGLTVGMPANGTVTATWQVQVNPGAPVNNPIVNIATAAVPNQPTVSTNPITTQISYADLTSTGNFIKSANPANVQPGSVVTYTLTLHNTGTSAANNVVVTDAVPAGTTYVPGSVTASVPFTGDPTGTIKLTAPIPAGGTATITFKVQIGNSVPTVNPIPNTADVNYSFIVDPSNPPVAATGTSNTTLTPVSVANLQVDKTASESIGYIGDIITYNIVVKNTGNVPADQVVITDPIPSGTVLVPGSLLVSVPYSGSLATAITLTNEIPAGGTVTITYQVEVTAIPSPNPIENIANTAYKYTVNPNQPDGVSGNTVSNAAGTVIFTNNYRQQITDMIESVALEEAALGNIMDAEGAKIQRFVSMPGVTPNMLLCLNKSVNNMTTSISLLQSIMQKKLDSLDCQISGNGMGC